LNKVVIFVYFLLRQSILVAW